MVVLCVQCVVVGISTTYALVKYAIHFVDVRRNGMWDGRHTLEFYSELVCDVLTLLCRLGHYAHIWATNGITFTLIDAVIFLDVRKILSSLSVCVGWWCVCVCDEHGILVGGVVVGLVVGVGSWDGV